MANSSSKTESQKLIDWVERLVSLVQLDNGAADEDTPNLALLKRRLSGETNGDWQPIETAPTNGKWVLLWWPNITDCAIVGYRGHEGWRSPIGSWDGYREGGSVGTPTLWQPLPNPPPEKSTCKPSASTGETPPAPTSPVECPKCRTQLAFEGDECGLCKEEE